MLSFPYYIRIYIHDKNIYLNHISVEFLEDIAKYSLYSKIIIYWYVSYTFEVYQTRLAITMMKEENDYRYQGLTDYDTSNPSELDYL